MDSAVLLRRPTSSRRSTGCARPTPDIGVARAELFPRISLTGLAGLASDTLGSLLSGNAFPTTIAADAAYTIFDAGGRRANVAVTEAERDAALAAYELAIQTAFREVADALAVQGTIGEQLRAARTNAEAAADAASLTQARYRGGVDSFLANLVAQRSLYTARRQETGVLLAGVRNRVALYRALGADAEVATPAVE
jgi:multidrug efflux system outer membrane protein